MCITVLFTVPLSPKIQYGGVAKSRFELDLYLFRHNRVPVFTNKGTGGTCLA